MSGSDLVKRQAAVKAALANGDEDELAIVLAETLAVGARHLSGSVTLSECDGKKQLVMPFSVTISDFDRASGGFRFEWRFPFRSGAGKGSLQGVMLGLASDSNWIFKGRFDGQAKVIGGIGSPYNPMCGSPRTLPAEVSIF